MITIIGTAHISKDSISEVREKILKLRPTVVAVELCESRYRKLSERSVPTFELIRSESSFVLIVNILLSFLQRKLGEWVGVSPGEEMLAAIETAKELNINVATIDRDIRATIGRAMVKMSVAEKIFLMKEMLTTFAVSKDELEKEMAKAKSDDHIDEILEKFKKTSPNAFEVLVSERDKHMARNLLELEKRFGSVVAVVGAGHRRGIEKYIANPALIPPIGLSEVPENRFGIAKMVKFGVSAFILLTFAIAFYRDAPLKAPLSLWAVNHAVPTFIGVLVARGSIVSAVVGMLVSPLTSLNPVLGTGWFAGMAEARVRKASKNNNAFKILLVAALANLGSMMGTFISLPTVVLPLLKSIWVNT